jgi:thiamine kinase-like enzyme
VCIRLPGKGTEEYINRANEAVAARQAATAGVSPEVLHFDEGTGVMVTRYVSGTETMSPDGFRRPGAPARAARAFRKLHDSGAVFASRFELFAMIDGYLKVLSTKDVALPAGYHDVVNEVNRSVRPALDARRLPLAPCHCDPLCENFLDAGDRMWIVDWEYAGMNDPMWDLGDLSVEGSFDERQDEEMMQGYFGREPAPAERARVVIYKAMCDLLWTLWGLIQLANANPADDFRRYADGRFERCRTLMEKPGFDGHVAVSRL